MTALPPVSAALLPIEFRPGRDVAYVDQLQNEMAAAITCDQYPHIKPSAAMLEDPDTLCLEVWFGGIRCGVFLVVPEDGLHIVHTLLVPPARGAAAIRAGRAAIAWVWAHTRWTTLHSYCLEGRREIMLFARACGFHISHSLDLGLTVSGERRIMHILQLNHS